jgi:cytochrome b involved in lipid metabolism
MNNKILAIIALVVVVAGGAFWYMQNEDAEIAKTINTMPAPVEQVSINTNSYTLAQVAEHSTQDNCWIAIEGKVYNVTSFISGHPGGNKILQGCGKDATEYFNGIREHMKAFVKALVQKMLVGKLQS